MTETAARLFKCGDAVEVYRPQHDAWCPGLVKSVEVFAHYTSVAGGLTQKTLPAGHVHLRHADGSESEYYDVGDRIQIFSVSANRWLDGKAVRVEALVQYTKPGGIESALQIPFNHSHLRNATPEEDSCDELSSIASSEASEEELDDPTTVDAGSDMPADDAVRISSMQPFRADPHVQGKPMSGTDSMPFTAADSQSVGRIDSMSPFAADFACETARSCGKDMRASLPLVPEADIEGPAPSAEARDAPVGALHVSAPHGHWFTCMAGFLMAVQSFWEQWAPWARRARAGDAQIPPAGADVGADLGAEECKAKEEREANEASKAVEERKAEEERNTEEERISELVSSPERSLASSPNCSLVSSPERKGRSPKNRKGDREKKFVPKLKLGGVGDGSLGPKEDNFPTAGAKVPKIGQLGLLMGTSGSSPLGMPVSARSTAIPDTYRSAPLSTRSVAVEVPLSARSMLSARLAEEKAKECATMEEEAERELAQAVRGFWKNQEKK